MLVIGIMRLLFTGDCKVKGIPYCPIEYFITWVVIERFQNIEEIMCFPSDV